MSIKKIFTAVMAMLVIFSISACAYADKASDLESIAEMIEMYSDTKVQIDACYDSTGDVMIIRETFSMSTYGVYASNANDIAVFFDAIEENQQAMTELVHGIYSDTAVFVMFASEVDGILAKAYCNGVDITEYLQ